MKFEVANEVGDFSLWFSEQLEAIVERLAEPSAEDFYWVLQLLVDLHKQLVAQSSTSLTKTFNSLQKQWLTWRDYVLKQPDGGLSAQQQPLKGIVQQLSFTAVNSNSGRSSSASSWSQASRRLRDTDSKSLALEVEALIRNDNNATPTTKPTTSQNLRDADSKALALAIEATLGDDNDDGAGMSAVSMTK